MTILKFEIDKYYLLQASIEYYYKNKRYINNPKKKSKNIIFNVIPLLKKLKIYDKKIFKLLHLGETNRFSKHAIEHFTSKNINKYLKYAIRQQEFKTIYNETIKNKSRVKKLWNKKEKKVIKIMNEICNTEIKHSEVNTSIVHENINEGHYDTSTNTLYWSGQMRKIFKNYDVIYLTHEYFHSIFPMGMMYHTIHELAIDSELQYRLNGTEYDINSITCNQTHLELVKKIYPYWIKYLEDKSETIFEFMERMNNMEKFKKYVKY